MVISSSKFREWSSLISLQECKQLPGKLDHILYLNYQDLQSVIKDNIYHSMLVFQVTLSGINVFSFHGEKAHQLFFLQYPIIVSKWY